MNFSHSLQNFHTLPSFKTRDVATMSRWAVVQARQGDPWAGLGLAYMAHERATRMQDPQGTMLALNASAMCHAMRNDEVTAIGAAVDAFLLAERLADESGIDHALTTIAGCAIPVATLADAGGLLRGVVERAMLRGEIDLEIRARVSRAIVVGDSGCFDDAEAELTEVLRLQELHASGHFSPSRLNLNMANLQKKRMLHFAAAGEQASAEAAFRSALALGNEVLRQAGEEQNAPVEILVRGILGTLHRAHGDAAAAIQILGEALPLARHSHVQGLLPFILGELAEAQRISGDTAQYVATLELALNESVAQRPTARAESLCRKLYAQAEADGRADDAEFWQRRADLEQCDYARACTQVGLQVDELCARLEKRLSYSQSRGGISNNAKSASAEPAGGV